MLLEKLQEHKNFTAHEKDVAEYILSHLDQISELSVGELAKASYTSKATVVRLSQKLGLNGFQDLKITLTAEINQKKRIDQLLANEPVTAESTYDDIVKTLPALYDKAVTNTRLSLDKNSMKRISQVLQKAECIDIYGTGISYILAQSAAFKISTLGLECSAYESINSHYLAARKHKKNIAFLISLTGSNHTVICMAKYLREATETYVVGIAGPYHTELKKWCHEIVEIPNRDALLSLDVITSFSGATYILDIFFALLLSKRYEEHARSSMEMLNHLNEIEFHLREHPILLIVDTLFQMLLSLPLHLYKFHFHWFQDRVYILLSDNQFHYYNKILSHLLLQQTVFCFSKRFLLTPLHHSQTDSI